MLDRRFCHRVWYCLALGALAFVTACTWEGASGPVESPSSAADSPEVGVPESEPPAAPLGPPPPPCASFQNIRPQQLATMLEDKDFLLINTNPPFYAKIESTDDHLPLDSPQIGSSGIRQTKTRKSSSTAILGTRPYMRPENCRTRATRRFSIWKAESPLGKQPVFP